MTRYIIKPVLLSDHCGLILINGFHYSPGLVSDIFTVNLQMPTIINPHY